MVFQILFEGTVAKYSDAPMENEDAYRIAQDRGRVVLSDGASESFDAHSWANLLVEEFLGSEPSDELVDLCVQKYRLLHDTSTLSWSKAAAYERGSFATLIVVQDEPDRKLVSVSALGDSLVIWADGSEILQSVPYSRACQFSDKPFLLSTRSALNAPVSGGAAGPWVHREWSYDQSGSCLLLCMTDALGAWILSSQERGDIQAFDRLCSVRSDEDLLGLVEAERASGAMRLDDSTLIIINLNSST